MMEELMQKEKKTKTCWWAVWVVSVIIVIVVGVAAYGYFYWCPLNFGKDAPVAELRFPPTTTCLTKDCLKAATAILSSLDETVDPCVDFYQFACGNFIPNIPRIPNLSLFQEELKKYSNRYISAPITGHEPANLLSQKTFFLSCMDLEAIDKDEGETFKELLESIGGWPLVKGQDWDDMVELEDFLVTCNKEGVPFEWFFRINYDIDQKVFFVTSPAPLEYDELFSNNKYKSLIFETAIDLGGSHLLAKRDIRNIEQFSKKLQRIVPIHYNGLDEYTPMRVDELDNVFPGISWANFFSNLTEEIVIPENETVMVLEKYMSDLNVLLAGTPIKVQIDYMVWKIIQYFAPYLPISFRNNFRITLANLTNVGLSDRFDFCIEEAINRYHQNNVLEFFKWQVNDKTLQNIANVIINVKGSLSDRIKSADWIGEKSKTVALMDLEKSFASLEYLNTDLYEEVLEKFSSIPDLEFTSDNITHIIRQSNIYKFNKQIWLADAYDDLYMKNISDAVDYLLQSLPAHMYSNQRPNYLNYAALGSDLASKAATVVMLNGINSHMPHLHGINENMSHESNKEAIINELFQNGNDSWSKDSSGILQDRAECIINDYDIIYEEIASVESTLARNYARLLGVNAAYEAYIAWSEENEEEPKLVTLSFTPVQLFWIEYASANCFPPDREHFDERESEYMRETLISALKNSDHFARDFDCPLNTPMNPDLKCDIF